MTLSIKHKFQSAKTDGADASLVQPSNWNDGHDLTGSNNILFGTNGTGTGGEIAVSTGLTLSASTLTVNIGTAVQAWDADLDAIAALAGTSGYLKKTAANTWVLDTASYLATTTIGTTVQGWDADLDAIGALAGTTGILKKTAANTWTLDTTAYQNQITASGLLKGAGSGSISAATAGTDYLVPPSGTSLLKGNSGGALANATAGTDYVAPGTATTFTTEQTFAGGSSALAAVLNNAAETTTVSATAATGTINYDITTQSVLYYTSNASADWTMNFRASSGTSLNTAMAIGQAVTVSFLNTNGATAYYNNAVQVDGSSVTPKWQSAAPTTGNSSAIDVYTYTIIKTANATFTVLASQTKFA